MFFNKLKSFEGVYSKRIDISDYSKGIYFLEIESENRMIKKKIIMHEMPESRSIDIDSEFDFKLVKLLLKN